MDKVKDHSARLPTLPGFGESRNFLKKFLKGRVRHTHRFLWVLIMMKQCVFERGA